MACTRCYGASCLIRMRAGSWQGAAVEDAAVAAAARVKGIPGRAPERTGCDATGRGMVTGIGRSALWRGVCPLGPSLGATLLYENGPNCRAQDLLLAARFDVGPVLGCLCLANRVPQASASDSAASSSVVSANPFVGCVSARTSIP